MKHRLLWISEHASPLALLGGADGGGQNVYVDQIAKHLASSGQEVDILTRRDRHEDVVEEAAKAGTTAVIQPGGSVRDADVIAAADRLGLAMVFTGMRHFLH